MKSYLQARRKALAPAIAQLAAAAVLWVVTGQIDDLEIGLGVSALVTALIVERTSNEEEG